MLITHLLRSKTVMELDPTEPTALQPSPKMNDYRRRVSFSSTCELLIYQPTTKEDEPPPPKSKPSKKKKDGRSSSSRSSVKKKDKTSSKKKTTASSSSSSKTVPPPSPLHEPALRSLPAASMDELQSSVKTADSDGTEETDVLSDDVSSSQQQQQDSSTSSSSSSTTYRLGDTPRSSEHMIRCKSSHSSSSSPSSSSYSSSAHSLVINDYAWIKRGNGSWTFAQLVDRSTNNDSGEDIMTFRVSELGHRKSLRPRRWSKMVRKCVTGVTGMNQGKPVEAVGAPEVITVYTSSPNNVLLSNNLKSFQYRPVSKTAI